MTLKEALKNKGKILNMQFEAMQNMATEKAVGLSNKYLNIYLNVSVLFFFCLMIIFLYRGELVTALMIFGFIHLHLLNTQVWHKLGSIEYFLESKMNNENVEDRDTDSNTDNTSIG